MIKIWGAEISEHRRDRDGQDDAVQSNHQPKFSSARGAPWVVPSHVALIPAFLLTQVLHLSRSVELDDSKLTLQKKEWRSDGK